MTPYLLLITLAILTYAIVFMFVRSERLPSFNLWVIPIGTSTAFLAMLISQTISIWYALLVIVALSFATAVLLAKQQESKTHD